MAGWTDNLNEAARAYLDGKRLDEVECIISDLPGIARGKAVPASKFARQGYFHPSRTLPRSGSINMPMPAVTRRDSCRDCPNFGPTGS